MALKYWNGTQWETVSGGEKGAKGDTGAAAGFGTPTATASAAETASVSVTASGLDTAKVFAFTFGLPKGDKGDTGRDGSCTLTALTVTLPTTGWTTSGSLFEQTFTVSGASATAFVLASPSPSSYSDYCSCEVRLTAQGVNSLTFAVTSIPATSITVNVMQIESEDDDS